MIVTINGLANSTALDGFGNVFSSRIRYAEYSAPTGPPGSGTITLSFPGSKTPSRTFPAWFTLAGPLISDTFADNGPAGFPAGCAVTPAIGTQGEQIVETQRTLDPVLGYLETRTTTSYVVDGFGPACITISDVLASYYDYTNDTTKIDYQSQNGLPNRIDTITQTLGMTSPTSPYSAVRRPESTTPVSPALLASRSAAIDRLRALQRAQQLKNLRNFALRISGKGTVR